MRLTLQPENIIFFKKIQQKKKVCIIKEYKKERMEAPTENKKELK